jgi:SAM-dependent methyltransferase
MEPPENTQTEAYADRLKRLSTPLWKRVLDVQAPYRWNLRRLGPGFLLDVGCGIGRNLKHVNGRGIGVDPNPACVAEARRAGLDARTPDELRAGFAGQPPAFDSLLFSHVLEHMRFDAAQGLVSEYLPYLKPAGQLILIAPQEAGYRSDPSHVEFLDGARLAALVEALGFRATRSFSFPFPRVAGRFFKYNEFVLTARRYL